MRTLNPVKSPWRFGTTLLLTLSVVPLLAMKASMRQDEPGMLLSVVDDWSSRHVVFSGARSDAQAEEMQYEPRYRQQWLRHNLKRSKARKADKRDSLEQFAVPTALEQFPVPGMTSRLLAAQKAAAKKPKPLPVPVESDLKQDWSTSLLVSGGLPGAVGVGMYPAKYTFDVTATPNCVTDYVIFNTSLASSTSIPNIVGFNRLYTTQTGTPQGYCAGAGPALLWSYRATTTSGRVQTSPVLSEDGKTVIFVENVGTASWLRVLRLKYSGSTPATEGTLTGPATPAETKTALSSCSANVSCLVTLQISTANSSKSAPFYDYANDALYVGDDAGHLHKFTGVLNGTLTKTGSPWPVTVTNTNNLNGPVLGSGGKVFVTGTDTATSTTGKVCSVTATGQDACASIANGLLGDSVIVDNSTGKVFAFSYLNGGTVHEYSVDSFISPTPVTKQISPSANTYLVYSGAFDHQYLTSAAGDGHLYVVGKSPWMNNRASLYRITLANGVMTSVDGSVDLASGNQAGGPVTGFYEESTDTDWFFTAVGSAGFLASGYRGQCPSATLGCVISLGVSGTTWPPGATTAGYSVPTSATAGASGIIVDNMATVGATAVPQTTLTSKLLGTSLATAVGTAPATCMYVWQNVGFEVGDSVTLWGGTANTVTVTAIPGACTGGTGITGYGIQTSSIANTHLVNTLVTSPGSTIAVASSAGFRVGDVIQVDQEAMQITGISGTTWTVTKALFSTFPGTHIVGTKAVGRRSTYLNGAITNSATSIIVDSNTTLDVGDYIQVENEIMLIQSKGGDFVTLGVSRGQLGSSAALHADGLAVTGLSKYPHASSIYFTFAALSVADTGTHPAASCYGSATQVGCAVKLTQEGFR